MIVTTVDDQLLMVSQNDHAHFAAELLKLWRTDGMPEHPRRQELLFAVREHDNGWREVDSAPMCQPSGAPHDFRSMVPEVRLELWQRSMDRFAEAQPYASLLINHHAFRINGRQKIHAEWRQALASWQQRSEQTAEEMGYPPDEVLADYRWLELLDALSLACCLRASEPSELMDFRARVVPRAPLAIELQLQPFPLVGATAFTLPCRLIEDRRYSSDTDLAVALASSRWQDLVVRVIPA